MKKTFFIKLLHKYLNGKATKEEQVFVEKYYGLFQNEPDVLDALKTDEKVIIKNNLKNSIANRISKIGLQDKKVRLIHNRYVKLAAAAVITGIVFVSSLYFLKNSSPEKYANVPAKTVAAEHIKNRVIFLPDGSRAILSPGSKLNYPSTFDGKNKREVYLEGQAFFDVKHKKSMPFIVHTGNIETKVLGTAFNIKALPGEDDIIVTVKRGRVSVNDNSKLLGIITPNQQMTYTKSIVKSLIRTVKNEGYLNWKQEDLLIDNLAISEAAKLIEDRYNVKIQINNPEIQSLRFTTTFSKNETLEEILNSICLFNGLVYTYNKEKSVINIEP
ncbi:MAG: FecR domain-containing protein [Ginsengibacter sp.]